MRASSHLRRYPLLLLALLFLAILSCSCSPAPASSSTLSSSSSSSESGKSMSKSHTPSKLHHNDASSSKRPVMLFGKRIDVDPVPKRAKTEPQQPNRQTVDQGKGKAPMTSTSGKEKHAAEPAAFHYSITDSILGKPIQYNADRHPIHPTDHHPANVKATMKKIHEESFFTSPGRYRLDLGNTKTLSKGHEETMKPGGGILDVRRKLIYHNPDTKDEDAFQKGHDGHFPELRQRSGYYRIAGTVHRNAVQSGEASSSRPPDRVFKIRPLKAAAKSRGKAASFYRIADLITGETVDFDPEKHPIHPIGHHPANMPSTLQKIHEDHLHQSQERYEKEIKRASVLSKALGIKQKPQGGVVDINQRQFYHRPGMDQDEAHNMASQGRFHEIHEGESGHLRLFPPRSEWRRPPPPPSTPRAVNSSPSAEGEGAPTSSASHSNSAATTSSESSGDGSGIMYDSDDGGIQGHNRGDGPVTMSHRYPSTSSDEDSSGLSEKGSQGHNHHAGHS